MVKRSIYNIKLSQAIFLGEVGEKNFTVCQIFSVKNLLARVLPRRFVSKMLFSNMIF